MMARLRTTMRRLKLIRVLRWLAGSAEDNQNALMATRVS